MGDEKSVADLLKRLQQEKYPLKGIFHLAGVLDDATLIKQFGIILKWFFVQKFMEVFICINTQRT